MRIIFIDDSAGRKTFATTLGATFLNAANRDFTENLEKLFAGKRPDLVVLDHFLDNLAVSKQMLTRGSTIAEAIKEKWPECPVICITAADKVRVIDERTKQSYDVVFDATHFTENVDRIEAIAQGFKQISKLDVADADNLIRLLKGPKTETVRLKATLPEKLQSGKEDTSVPSLFFNWFSHLTSRSGFLYDRLTAATFLGLTEPGFEKVASKLKKAKYGGIFNSSNQNRWWSSMLGSLLFEAVEPLPSELSWDTGRRFPEIGPGDYSKCYVCRKATPPPEVVGYLDQESKERRAMHFSCTVLHPNFKRELYFDDVRIMEGE